MASPTQSSERASLEPAVAGPERGDSAWHRLVGFARSPGGVLAAIFVVYLLTRLLLALGGQVFTSFDSAAYSYRDDPARNHGPLVSFFGHAPRPWGLPLFYAVFDSDHTRAVAQWLVGTVAWAGLGWELSRHLRTRTGQAVTFAAVLGLACLNTVASWDFAILTESMSISLGVAVLALALRWARTSVAPSALPKNPRARVVSRVTGSTVALGAMAGVGVWWTFIRPDIRIFITVLIGVLLLLAARGWRATRKGGEGRAVRPILIASAVLVLGIGWYAAITPAMNEAFKPYDGDAAAGNPLTLDQEIFVYRLRVDVSTNPRMWGAYKTKLGMPTCPEVEAFLTTATSWDSKGWTEAYLRCPPMVAWAQEHQDPLFWTDIAKADPALAAGAFGDTLASALGGSSYAHLPQVVPAPVERAVYPSRQHGLAVSLLYLGVALAVALVAGARRRHARLLGAGLVLAGASLLSAIATVVVHSGEYWRFGIQETIGIRLAVIVFLAAALDSWLVGRRERRAGTVAPEQRVSTS